MLSIDFLQPTVSGEFLAVVRFTMEHRKKCDLALVRIDSLAAAELPEWYQRVPETWEALLTQPFPTSMYVSNTIARNPKAWKALGYEALVHHKDVPMRWRYGEELGEFTRLSQELLQHPLWLAARQAKLLDDALGSAPSGRAAARL